jgi:hypothetical protein
MLGSSFLRRGRPAFCKVSCCMTADSVGLRFELIIQHHNSLLDGFDAGDHVVEVAPISDIRL